MKKTLITLAALALASVASADVSQLATMEQLVAGGTLGTGVTLDTSLSGTVYTFTGSGAITNISNSSILGKVNGGTGYLTIAAWINPSSTTENSIFGVGGQNDGFKFALKEGELQVTTKGVADKNQNGNVSTNTWTLVAVTINLSESGNSLFYVGDTTKQTSLGGWNDLTNNYFAIGSGNGGGLRDGYKGSIANLTVLYSDNLSDISYSTLTSYVGDAAPVAVPEPATATLSLLALAGLAARRRRK